MPSRYVHEYKKLMNRLNHCGKKETFSRHRNNFISSKMRKLAMVLKLENYGTRKTFVQEICSFLDHGEEWRGYTQIRLRIHELVFAEIVLL